MRGLLLLLLSLPLLCQSAPLTLKMCIFDHAFPPLTYPGGGGLAQEVLRRASQLEPVVVNYLVAPREQCLSRLQNGESDAMLGAWLPERTEYAAYPMEQGQPDPLSSLGDTYLMVFRQRGAKVDWDGEQFIGLGRQPVGVQPGMLYVPQLRAMGAVVDESGGSPEDNLLRLQRHQVAAVIGQQGDYAPLIAQHYRNEIEMLPRPFKVTANYLIVNRTFYQRHQAAVDAYWAALRQVRRSPSYLEYLRFQLRYAKGG